MEEKEWWGEASRRCKPGGEEKKIPVLAGNPSPILQSVNSQLLTGLPLVLLNLQMDTTEVQHTMQCFQPDMFRPLKL